jgi:P27 family predicted phage terminase small subunit
MSGVKGQRSGGHNRLPTILKRTKGTEKPSRVNPDEPQPTAGDSTPPDWLSAEELIVYHRLEIKARKMNVMSEVDGDALALAAAALVEYRQAKAVIKKHGMLIKRETKFGTSLVGNPACTVAAGAWRRYQSGLKSFGMDPQARGTVSTLPAKDDDPTSYFN